MPRRGEGPPRVMRIVEGCAAVSRSAWSFYCAPSTGRSSPGSSAHRTPRPPPPARCVPAQRAGGARGRGRDGGRVRTRNASCTPGLLQARASRTIPSVAEPGRAICLSCRFARLAERGKSRVLQESLDGETRTRTGDTTIFRCVRSTSESWRFAGLPRRSGRFSRVPAFPAFCGGLPDVTADGGGRRPFQFGLLAGYIMVLFDDRRRGLHDRIARAVVIDARKHRHRDGHHQHRGLQGRPRR
jgi:hypothetical protein